MRLPRSARSANPASRRSADTCAGGPSEQRGFITAGAGAHFEHRARVVSRIARGQELDRQRAPACGRRWRISSASATAIPSIPAPQSDRRSIRSEREVQRATGAPRALRGNRFDRGIVLGQSDEPSGDRSAAFIASASSCLRDSIDAILSDEIWVMQDPVAANRSSPSRPRHAPRRDAFSRDVTR